jgi:hypothetical protein
VARSRLRCKVDLASASYSAHLHSFSIINFDSAPALNLDSIWTLRPRQISTSRLLLNTNAFRLPRHPTHPQLEQHSIEQPFRCALVHTSVRWTLLAPSNSTDFDFKHHPRACPKPCPGWDASSLFNPTPRLLTKTDIASIADSDASSIEDSIGQPSKHTGLYILSISRCWDLHKHSLFAVLTLSLLTTLASFQTFLSYRCYEMPLISALPLFHRLFLLFSWTIE